jgi:hypothetical protein
MRFRFTISLILYNASESLHIIQEIHKKPIPIFTTNSHNHAYNYTSDFQTKDARMKRLWMIVGVGLFLSACQTQPEPLPTLVSIPSVEPTTVAQEPTATPTTEATQEVTAEVTPEATTEVTAEATLEPSATITETSTPSPEPSVTSTATSTPIPATATTNPTVVAIASATQLALEQPIFSTFTPAPAGSQALPTATGTPRVAADVVISEVQFQEELSRLLADNPQVTDAEVDFTPEGVVINLSASGGDAITSGSFTVFFQMSRQEGGNSFLQAYADSPADFRMSGDGVVSDAFITTAYESVVPAVFEAFNFILNQRLGEGRHDLENLVIDDNNMSISLLVRR